MSFPELEQAQRKRKKQVATANYLELEQARAKAIEQREVKYQMRKKAFPAQYTAFVQQVSAHARQEVRSARFYRGLGFPEFAGRYAPFEIPEGFKVQDIQKTPEGLDVTFEPVEKPALSVAEQILGFDPWQFGYELGQRLRGTPRKTVLGKSEITHLLWGGAPYEESFTKKISESGFLRLPVGSTKAGTLEAWKPETWAKPQEVLAGVVGIPESTFYGVGSLVGGVKKTLETGQPQLAYGWEWAGLKTPRLLPTVSGALISKYVFGKPEGMEWIEEHPGYAFGSVLGELGQTLLIGKGIEKAGVGVKKLGSWMYEKSGIKYSHTLYKMKESWRAFSVKHVPEVTVKRSHAAYQIHEAWKPIQQKIPSFRGSKFESWLIQHSEAYRKYALKSLTYGEVSIPVAEKFVGSTYQAIPKGLPYTYAAWDFTLFPRTGGVMLTKIATEQTLKQALPLFIGIGKELIPFSEIQAQESMLSFTGGKPARTFKYEQIEHLGGFSKVQWTMGFEGKYGFAKPRMPTLQEFMAQQKLLPFTTQTHLTRAGIFPFIPKIGYFTKSTKDFLSHILGYGLVSAMRIPSVATGKKLKYETVIPPLTLPKPITYPEAKPKRRTKPSLFTFPSIAPVMREREKLYPWSLPGFKQALKQVPMQKQVTSQIQAQKQLTRQIVKTSIPTPTTLTIPGFPFEERRKRRYKGKRKKRKKTRIGRYKRYYPVWTPEELLKKL